MSLAHLAATAILIAGSPPLPSSAETPLFRWYEVPSIEPLWTVPRPGEGGAIEAGGTPLSFTPRFAPLPPLSIEILGGGRFDLAQARGNVVLLDFWASWCAPCLRELPHLEELWRERRERGLLAVAVNAEEPEDLALGTARKLGLTLPIGAYDATLDGIFRVRTLPTVVLLDREGRLRGRWDGYVPGLERSIAEATRRLLDGDPDGAPREIARVLGGSERLEVAWVASLPAPAGGLAFYRDGSGAPRVAATAGRDLVLLDGRGEPVRRLRVPPDVDRLARVPAGPNGAPRLVSWRVGGDRAVLIEPEKERVRAILAPAAIYDLAVERRAPDSASLLWATAFGFYRTAEDGSAPARAGEPFEARRVARAARAGEDLYFVLDRDGALRAFDPDGIETGRHPVAGDGPILAAAGGVGVADRAVLDAAPLKIAGSLRDAVFLAAAPDRLLLVDAATGGLHWSARWSDVASVDAGDLDGDGADELLVAAGRTVAALRRVPPAPPSR